MAKLGRYSADRKKVESITTATKTVEVAECGTVFALNRAAGVALTLPTIAAAGNGWWCKVVVQTALNSNSTIASSDGAGSIIGPVAAQTPDAQSSTITHDGATITIAAAADVAGDQVELVAVNGAWVLNGIAST